jgi:hypothetical protein
MTFDLAKVYRRHHPREHELFETVDDEYERRLSTLVARRPKEGRIRACRRESRPCSDL